MEKIGKGPQRVFEITKEERQATRSALAAFKYFVKQLQMAQKADKRLVDVLEKNKEADPKDLFDIRHLLRRFQQEVKDRYTALIYLFAGKKDANSNVAEEGVIHSLKLLDKDTTIRNIKTSLQDAVQQLTEFAEEFLEAFEKFNDPNQIKEILASFKQMELLTQTIENVIDKQLKPHFERNILKRTKFSSINGTRRRIRLLEMLVKYDS